MVEFFKYNILIAALLLFTSDPPCKENKNEPDEVFPIYNDYKSLTEKNYGKWFGRNISITKVNQVALRNELSLEEIRNQRDTRIGIQGTEFTINGIPTFLYGISYYGGLGAPDEFIISDIADIKNYGFNWIRVWATWKVYDFDVSAVDSDGNIVEGYMDKLVFIIKECNRNGIVVDVTLSRGKDNNGIGLNSFDSHKRAVEAIVNRLKPFKNWYLDLSNEHNVKDNRFVSFEELKQLCQIARQINPELLITSSNGHDVSYEAMNEYLFNVKVDFMSPHRGRYRDIALETGKKTEEYLSWMKDLHRQVPIHYQEPFRRGYSKQWEPQSSDFVIDLSAAKNSGAAGWCFHNGSQKGNEMDIPRRSFDMRKKRLFDQLDQEEIEALKQMYQIVSGNDKVFLPD